MTVAELKEELAARDEAVSGNKAWLRLRLHAAIVREYLDAKRERPRSSPPFTVVVQFYRLRC